MARLQAVLNSMTSFLSVRSEDEDERDSLAYQLKREAPSWLTSVGLHVALLLLLSLIAFTPRAAERVLSTIIGGDGLGNSSSPAAIDTLAGQGPVKEIEAIAPIQPIANLLAVTADVGEELAVVHNPKLPEFEGAQAAGASQPVRSNGKKGIVPGIATGNIIGTELGGRGLGNRVALVKAGGGTPQSEQAVELGLKWLAKHQKTDGSWSFQHGDDDPGSLQCPPAATGLALLCFLGAGHTHKQGNYMTQVDAGLKYLVGAMQVGREGGDLRWSGGGSAVHSMYTQGICTIVLCEAYALTKDRTLLHPAQLAADFIVHAQHRPGGGWRYGINTPGDTSVVGWQIMALKSARSAKLTVPARVFNRASYFLDHTQSNGGATYGYMGPGNGGGTTAVGLLSRIYLGWNQNHKGLKKGVQFLSQSGPDKDRMYYSYYATQVLHHWGGELWEKWNNVMREQLVTSQIQTGDAAGSWNRDHDHSEAGGRLYTTCMCIMTLEVYYRYLPLYQWESAPSDQRAAADDMPDADE